MSFLVEATSKLRGIWYTPADVVQQIEEGLDLDLDVVIGDPPFSAEEEADE